MARTGIYVYYNADNYFYMRARDGSVHDQHENIQNKILNNHRRILRNAVERLRMSPEELSLLETEYNRRAEDVFRALKETLGVQKDGSLAISTTEQEELLTKLVQSFGYKSQQEIDEIVNNLQWDQSIESFRYVGTNLNQGGSATIAPIGDVKDFHYADTVLRRIDDFEKSLKTMQLSPEQLKAAYKGLGPIKKHLAAYVDAETDWRTVIAKIRKKQRNIKVHKAENRIDWGQEIRQELIALRSQLAGFQNINKTIQWHFAELLGNFIAKDSVDFSMDFLKQELQEFLISNAGKTVTKAIKGSKSKINVTDQEVLAQVYSEKSKGGKTVSGITKRTTKDGNVTYQLTPIQGKAGKQDSKKFRFTVTINGIKYRKAYAPSIKNTVLQINKAGEDLATANGTVRLQKTVLRTYLEGAEKQFNINGLTYHYLNLFAGHKKTGVKVSQSELERYFNQARDNMKATILYSALTGAAQGRVGRQANILVVQDKSNSSGITRIRIFDMGQIVADLVDSNFANENAIVGSSFAPIDHYPVFANKKIGTTDNLEQAQKRSLRVLAEAGSTLIELSLAKEYLVNSIKARGK